MDYVQCYLDDYPHMLKTLYGNTIYTECCAQTAYRADTVGQGHYRV